MKTKYCNKLTWIIAIVIVVGIIAYAYPQFFPGIKDKISEKTQAIQTSNIADKGIKTYNVITNKPNNVVSKCRQSFNQCEKIYNKKFDISLSVSEIQKVDDLEQAQEFYNIWKGRLGDLDKYSKQDRVNEINQNGFPQVLIAYSFVIPKQNVKLPSLVTCDSEGELTQSSREGLSCG